MKGTAMNRQEKAMRRPTQAYGWMGTSELLRAALRTRARRYVCEFLVVAGALALMSVLTVGTIVLVAATVVKAT
jgi:hypothetical protein